MAKRKPRPVSSPQVVQIAAASTSSPVTVVRVYDGGGSEHSRERVTRAARELGYPLPGEPSK